MLLYGKGVACYCTELLYSVMPQSSRSFEYASLISLQKRVIVCVAEKK